METDFKKTLASDLHNKGLSPSSIKLYVSNLERLNDELPLKNLTFLNDVDRVLDKIKNLKLTTQRGYLISISSVLEMYKTKNKKNTELYNKYYDIMINLNDKLKAIPTNKMTETQKTNWENWDDIKSKYESLEKEVNEFINNTTISKNNYNKLLEYMVLSLYVLLEPRRNEYTNVLVVKKHNPNMSIEHNYLSYDDKKFIFNKYKTSKKRGVEIINIGDDLMNVINKYFKFHPLIKGKVAKNKQYEFLVNYDGGNLASPNGITRILNKVFGKRISSSMLRHIYITSLFGDTVKQMEETAQKMGHSISTQKDYIKDVKTGSGIPIVVKFD
jgi:integrase